MKHDAAKRTKHEVTKSTKAHEEGGGRGESLMFMLVFGCQRADWLVVIGVFSGLV